MIPDMLLDLLNDTRDDYVMEAIESSCVAFRKNSTRRCLLLIAAVLALALLLVGCGVLYGLRLFESPAEMISTVFGDKTGYDHKSFTYFTDSQKPDSIIENPAYDRVPADTKAVADVAPHVTAVGKTITLNDFTLTIDGFLYDGNTQCGIVTYSLENPNGLPEYRIQPNGKIGDYNVQFSQYGYACVMADKMTDTSLVAAYYFRYDPAYMDGVFSVCLYDDNGYDPEAESDRIEAQVKEKYTPEEAIAAAQAYFGGEEAYRAWADQFQGYCSEAEAAYKVLGDKELLEAETIEEESDPIFFECNSSQQLDNVTLRNGAVVITPISLVVDVSGMEFLRNEHGDLDTSCIREQTIRFSDDTEYVLKAEQVDNLIFANGGSVYADGTFDDTHLTAMFNRIIDVEKIRSICVNGVELPLD